MRSEESLAILGAAIVAVGYPFVSGGPVIRSARSIRSRISRIGPASSAQSKGWRLKPETRTTGCWRWCFVRLRRHRIDRVGTGQPVTMRFPVVVFGARPPRSPSLVAVFLFDLFVAQAGAHFYLCPVRRLLARLLGSVRRALVKVSTFKRAYRLHCMDCYAVCPEPHVISPARRKGRKGRLAGDLVPRLHHLRPLYRRLRSRRLPLHHIVSMPRDRRSIRQSELFGSSAEARLLVAALERGRSHLRDRMVASQQAAKSRPCAAFRRRSELPAPTRLHQERLRTLRPRLSPAAAADPASDRSLSDRPQRPISAWICRLVGRRQELALA